MFDWVLNAPLVCHMTIVSVWTLWQVMNEKPCARCTLDGQITNQCIGLIATDSKNAVY